jgi:hypothetical protein
MRDDWFNLYPSECKEGLYRLCCNGVCSNLEPLDTEQKNAQGMVPVVLALAVGGILLNGATARMDFDNKALASWRIINAAGLVIFGIVVTAQLMNFHDDELDDDKRGLGDAYWYFVAAWSVTAVDMLMLQPFKLFALTLGEGFSYSAMGART